LETEGEGEGLPDYDYDGRDRTEQTNTIEELADSIAELGQRTPVHVITETQEEYSHRLTAGFRRMKALYLLAKRGERLEGDPTWDPIEPTVIADVFDWTPLGARIDNLVENTARENIHPSDLVAGLQDVVHLFRIEHSRTPTREEIAKMLGKSQPYIGRLLTLVDRMHAKDLAHWRVTPNPVSLQVMIQASEKFFPDERREAYQVAIKGAQRDRSEGVHRRDRSLGRTRHEVERFAERLGRLHARGEIDASAIQWGEGWLSDVVSLRPRWRDTGTVARLGRAARRAFARGVASVKTTLA
jgi:hypothetical protein